MPDEDGYDAAGQLSIDPEECIDCEACVEACPVSAIRARNELPAEWSAFADENLDFLAAS